MYFRSVGRLHLSKQRVYVHESAELESGVCKRETSSCGLAASVHINRSTLLLLMVNLGLVFHRFTSY